MDIALYGYLKNKATSKKTIESPYWIEVLTECEPDPDPRTSVFRRRSYNDVLLIPAKSWSLLYEKNGENAEGV